ncbi:hypothetical protein I545_2520 [Mycobacterium kansasii 662]|uniref:Uncharacterized protein n=1 Tax=Mycobacterium kansasii 662 TaxID=1299326 RepID=X7ZHR0_MYCKA|nr:hypothetical protein I545_2520 [Mycobacterium kansasii 662]
MGSDPPPRQRWWPPMALPSYPEHFRAELPVPSGAALGLR